MGKEIVCPTKTRRVVESEGFEPSIGDKPYTPLAGARLQPLGQLSEKNSIIREIEKLDCC